VHTPKGNILLRFTADSTKPEISPQRDVLALSHVLEKTVWQAGHGSGVEVRRLLHLYPWQCDVERPLVVVTPHGHKTNQLNPDSPTRCLFPSPSSHLSCLSTSQLAFRPWLHVGPHPSAPSPACGREQCHSLRLFVCSNPHMCCKASLHNLQILSVSCMYYQR